MVTSASGREEKWSGKETWTFNGSVNSLFIKRGSGHIFIILLFFTLCASKKYSFVCIQYLIRMTFKNCRRSKWPKHFYTRLVGRRKSATTCQPWGCGRLSCQACRLGWLFQSLLAHSIQNQSSLRATSSPGLEKCFIMFIKSQQPSFLLPLPCVPD